MLGGDPSSDSVDFRRPHASRVQLPSETDLVQASQSMTPSSNNPLLLVGFQGGVVRGLEALGRPAYVILARGRSHPEHELIRGVCEVDLHADIAPIVEAARELLGEATPAAIVALAERTVVVAAQLRAAFGLPGNSPATALACADKLVMKRCMDAAGIPVAPWREVKPDTSAEELMRALGLPILIKPRRDSGGREQRRCDDQQALRETLAHIAGEQASKGWLAEAWLVGREMSIESLVHEGSVCFSSPTEYFVPRHANIVPAALEPELWERLQDFVQGAIGAVGVERGITHLELFQTEQGLVFGELASRPPGGRLMTLLTRAYDSNAWEALLRLEVGEPVRFPSAAQRTAGVWILHPGSGTLLDLEGVEEVRALPGIRRLALKVSSGSKIAERAGSGQDIGAIYAEGSTRDEVAQVLAQARSMLRFELG